MIIARLPMNVSINLYLSLIKHEIKKNVRLYKKSLKNIIDMYTLEKIDNAIEKSIIKSNNYILVQTDGSNGKILRSLEYGTSNNKSLKIISQSVNKILKEVNLYEPNIKF